MNQNCNFVSQPEVLHSSDSCSSPVAPESFDVKSLFFFPSFKQTFKSTFKITYKWHLELLRHCSGFLCCCCCCLKHSLSCVHDGMWNDNGPKKKKKKKIGCSSDIFRLPRAAHVRRSGGGCTRVLLSMCLCVKRVSVWRVGSVLQPAGGGRRWWRGDGGKWSSSGTRGEGGD